jgi:hypothetical protein
MNVQYIIAGNHMQYMSWLSKQKNIHCQYVGIPDVLRGIENPHGVFIGTWYERKDMYDILIQLVAASRVDNPALRKAIDYYESRKK